MKFFNTPSLLIAIMAFIMPADCQTSKHSDVNAWQLATSKSTITQQEMYDLAQLGFKYIEVGGLPRAKTDSEFEAVKKQAEQIRQYADYAGIKIWSIHIPFGYQYDPSVTDTAKRKKAIERINRILIAVQPLGISKAILHPSAEPIKPEERAARINACKASLPIIAANAAKMGIQIAVENLPRTCLGNTSEEMLCIVGNIKGIGICCDTNHMLKETTQNFIHKAGSLIVTVHISDYDGIDEKHWLPGHGTINWNEVISALSEIGYTGPFMFEANAALNEKAQCFDKLKDDYFLYAKKLADMD